MSILEWVGFVVVSVAILGAVLHAAGLLSIHIGVEVKKGK